MNDVDRWINLEGPEPDGIRELLDAARDVPDLTPEQDAYLRHTLRRALAEQEHAWARDRRRRWMLAGGILAAGAAAAVTLAVWRSTSPVAPIAGKAAPGATIEPVVPDPATLLPAMMGASTDPGAMNVSEMPVPATGTTEPPAAPAPPPRR